MKSRSRPPLTLSDPEPAPLGDATAGLEDAATPELVVKPQAAPERPMSERRRRRLLEQERSAADLEFPSPAEPEPTAPVAPPIRSEDAEPAIEPLAFSMRTRRATNCATAPAVRPRDFRRRVAKR